MYCQSTLRQPRPTLGMPAHRRRGAMLIVVAIALPVLLIMTAFAVNVAFMELTRTELRAATDFATRAGARTLSMNGDQAAALAAAQDTASRNTVAGTPLVLLAGDVEFGLATEQPGGDYSFTPTGVNPNALRVHSDRGAAGQAVPLLFSGVLGRSDFEPDAFSVAAQIDREIAIVLDRSGSMAQYTAAGDNTGWSDGQVAPSTSRWQEAVDGIHAFLGALEGTPMDEQVSLITYEDVAITDQGLTYTYPPIESAIDAYTQAYTEGMTNISDGIELGRQSLVDSGLARSWAAKTIVLLTDGKHNTGGVAPVTAATTAAAQGVIVHTITFGNNANQADMQAVATAGNGQHWHAPTQTELFEAFNEIADNLPTTLIE